MREPLRSCLVATPLLLALLGLGPLAAAAAQQSETPSATGTARKHASAKKKVRKKPDEPWRVTLDDKGLTATSPAKDVKLKIGGRLHADAGGGRSHPRVPEAAQGGTEIRRARIEAQATIRDAIELVFQYDFADPTTPIKDAAVAYRGVSPFVVTLGNVNVPFSLQQIMSSNNILFIERALPTNALAPLRETGFVAGSHGERWTLTAGIFGGNINTGVGREGVAGIARATYAPILEPGEVLHFGIAGSVRARDEAPSTLSFSTRPEADLFRASLVDTGPLVGATTVSRLGLEAAYQRGPFRLQGEYIAVNVGRTAGRPDVAFQGGYLEGAWVLNGPGWHYQIAPDYGTSFGIFKGLEVPNDKRIGKGGVGVFELAMRVSYLDLENRDIRGGVERNWTMGLNWYPDKNVRLMANYIRAHAERSPVVQGNVDADIGELRLQLYW